MTRTDDGIEDRARAVFGRRADMYVASQAHTDPQVLGRLVELAQPQPNWRVLDVATGAGHTAFALAPYVAEVVAVDLTPEMLVEAEKLARGRGIGNVHFQEADVHRLPFDDGTFDLVTCRRAAHHFRDVDRALAEMVRALRKPGEEQAGGLLIVDDRSVPEDDFVDAVMNRLDWLHDESHVRQYRPDEWRGMLERAGCQVLAVEPYTRHRPLRSLTDRVSPENVAQLHAILDGLTAEQQARLDLRSVGGERHSTHWYVTVMARRVR